MKSNIIFSFVLILLITISCKKDSETINSRNFIEINGDKRLFGSNLDLHLFIDHGTYDLGIYDAQYSKEIAGYLVDRLEIHLVITDSNLLDNTTDALKLIIK
ncbi:hypothetical protein AQPE_1629 [Aquipluma nitroreducens]|uniref:Uncharacterized protein n=1 Tax=Aquipluma nitroreducens TaxID=2010828 RepID=A0A5K7S7Q5_9BACT|nr:hypothetical protein AQPE_1629 [Aquipluma nitroreducens]